MMTRTSLSAAIRANKGNPRLQWHRHSCLPRGGRRQPKGLCAVPLWQPLRTWLPHRIATLKHQEEAEAHVASHKFLIANPELEFNVSPIRINDLKFSNRKFSAIFQFIFPSLKTPTPRSVILLALTQEGKASDQDARSEGSQLSPHSTPPPPAQAKLLIETPRLKIPRNLNKTKPIPISNRDKSGTLRGHNSGLVHSTTFRAFQPLC